MPPIPISVQNTTYTVHFPFTPYPSQLVMMEKILLALHDGQNALLESPTGTGKTLCLLCASLAFAEEQKKKNTRKKNKNYNVITTTGGERNTNESEKDEDAKRNGTTLTDAPPPPPLLEAASARENNRDLEVNTSTNKSKATIVYVSRTHSQLQQVISELKATAYKPHSSIVGSRKQLCVNEWVAEAAKRMGDGNKRGAEKLCKIACSSEKCDKKMHVGTYMERVFGIDVVNGWTGNSGGGSGGEFGSLGYGRTKNDDGKKNKKKGGSILSHLPPNRDDNSNNNNNNKGEGKVTTIMDIEDLVKEGNKAYGPCPYYLAREMTRGAEIIFAPYSYILDAGVRRNALGDTVMNWHNSIVIFDEAHNAESACEEAASRDLTAVHIANAIKDADGAFQWESRTEEVMESLGDDVYKEEKKKGTGPTRRTAADYLTLRGIFSALEREIAIVCAQDQERVRKGETLPSSRDGWFIFDLLAKVNINSDTFAQIIEVCEDALNVVALGGEAIEKGSGAGLERVKEFLERAFEAKRKGLVECYRSRVGPPEEEFNSTWNTKNAGKENKLLAKGPTISFWCMVPGVIVNELCELGVRSLLLASGTLSPMDSFASELRAPFPVRLENPHVIPQENVWAGAFLKGPSNTVSLNSSYRFRDTEQYKNELGLLILRVARVTPDGVLVFFPSYGVMAKCIEFWKKRTNIWNDIMRTTRKTLIVEPKESDAFLEAFESFNKALDRSSKANSWSKVGLTNGDGSAKDGETAVTLAAKGGAMFFAVCRGKVSEGIDFADKAGRAVILTGIPYAPKASARVRYKREFLDAAIMVQKRNNTYQNFSLTSGEQWYSQTAMRAANQALGRVIRHKDDFGAVILADERFAYRNHQNQLSLWLRPAMQTFDTFERGIESLSAFFERCGNPNSALMLAAAEKSAKKKKRKVPLLQSENEKLEAEPGEKKSNTKGAEQVRKDTNFSKKSRVLDTSLSSALMNAMNNNNNENEVDEDRERRNLFSGAGGGGGGGGGGAGGGSLASRLLKAGGNRDNTTRSSVGNGSAGGASGNANDVDKAILAKQKLVKRARAELPPEDFPKFIEAIKTTVSAESSDAALHESMKMLAKLCKIEKRGVDPSTLWAAIGTGLALKDGAKKAYEGFEKNAKQKLEEKAAAAAATAAATTKAIPPLVAQSSQLPAGGNIFGRPAKQPRDSSQHQLKSNADETTSAKRKEKKKTSCDHCKAAKCDRPFQSSICGHFACYKCFNAVFASNSTKSAPNSGPCPTCSTLVTKKSLKKLYL